LWKFAASALVIAKDLAAAIVLIEEKQSGKARAEI